jgi:L-fuculose-phosphate aldolase
MFGTEKLSVLAIEALINRKACLLSNHGLIAIGVDLEDALAIAIEVENLCEQYILSTQIGKPILLSKNDMKSVLKSFKNYGRGLNK